MKEWVKVFLAFLAIVTGLYCVAELFIQGMYFFWFGGIIGVILLAGGATYFWTRTNLYKR